MQFLHLSLRRMQYASTEQIPFLHDSNVPLDKEHRKKKTSERQNIPQETETHLSLIIWCIIFWIRGGRVGGGTLRPD
ncbi:MAG: hypothetical protein R3B93_20420 [Bacteroidia bacterium]